MKVVREITFEGTEEQLIKQSKGSAPDGTYRLPDELVIKIVTVLCPTIAVQKALDFAPRQWPMQYREKEKQNEKDGQDVSV